MLPPTSPSTVTFLRNKRFFPSLSGKISQQKRKLQIWQAHAASPQVVAHEQSRDVVAVVDVLPRLRARVPFVGLRAAHGRE